MKCFNLKKLSTLMLITLLLGLFLPQKIAFANEKEGIELNVSYGLDGKFKTYRSIPINIEVINKGSSIDGLLEVRVQTTNPNVYDSFAIEVSILENEKRNFNIPILMGDSGNRIEVVLHNGNNIVSSKKLIIDAGRVLDHYVMIGTLTDDFNGVSYLGDIKLVGSSVTGPGDIKTVNIELDNELLQNNIRNLDALDILLINNYATSKLSKEAMDNLNLWVKQGGIMIIGTGENSSKTLSGLKDTLIDYEYNGVLEKNINIEGSNVSLNMANIDLQKSNEAVKSGDNVLAYSVQQELGKVYITTFDLGSETFSNFDKKKEFLIQLIGQDALSKSNVNINQGSDIFRIKGMINTVPIEKEVNTFSFILLFGIYTITVALILYFVLKKLNKREYIWGIAPIIAILFTIIIYFLGNSTRIKDIVINQTNIIRLDEEGNGIGNGYIGIGSKLKSDLEIYQPNTNIDIKYLSDPYGYFGGASNKTEAKKLGIRTMYSDNTAYYQFENSGALDLKPFEVSGYKEKLINFESNISFNENGIQGYIKNNTSNDVEKMILIVGKNAWDLGTVKDGSEIKLEGIKAIPGSSFEGIATSLQDEFYRKYRGNITKEEKEKLKNITRYSSFMSVLNMETGIETPCIIAFSNKEVDYDLDFKSKSVSKFNTTAIIQKIKVDYKDSEGYSNYPYGHFKNIVIKNDPNVYVDDFYGTVYGIGEVEYGFIIDKAVDINSINIGMKDFSIYGGNNDFNIDIEIFNNKTNSYDLIELNKDKEYKLENVDDYLLNNELKVKVNYKDEKGATIPSISVRGME